MDDTGVDLRSSYQAALADLNEFKEEVEEGQELTRLQGLLSDTDRDEQTKLERFRAETLRLVDQLTRLLDRAYAAGEAPEQNSALGAQVIISAQALEAEVQWFHSYLKQVDNGMNYGNLTLTASVKQATVSSNNWVQQTLLPTLRRALSKVFQFILGMLTPKEWSITGVIGNNFLGFASGELSITFGPSSGGGGGAGGTP
jgi:hypothetical protein